MSWARLWWSLSGPQHFLEDLESRLLEFGLVGVACPVAAPPGLRDAVREYLVRHESLVWNRIDLVADPPVDPPAMVLARRLFAPGEMPAIPSAATLVRASALDGYVVWLEGMTVEAWPDWDIFLRSLARERAGVGGSSGPMIALSVPPGIVFEAAGRSLMTWRGRVRRLDTALYVATVMRERAGGPLRDGFIDAVVVELAGYDPRLVDSLAEATDDELLDAVELLQRLAAEGRTAPGVPSWQAGTLDNWDGRPFVHSLLLAANDDRPAIERRLWHAHVAMIFPWLEEVRLVLTDYYRHRLKMPAILRNGDVIETVDDFEFGPLLYEMRKQGIAGDERHFIELCRDMRHMIAHREPVGREHIRKVERAWSALRARFEDGANRARPGA